jgi:hypothetical protein
MTTLDKIFGFVAALLQLAIAVLLFWASSADLPPNALIPGGTVGSAEITQLISEYRQALVVARAIFTDAGITLACSFGLTVIVLYRQLRKTVP